MAYDVVIIGAGPAGLTAGIYARSKMMSTLILESGVVGGQLVALYPEKGIHNYPGYENVQARKLSDKLYAQAESLDCEILEHQRVTDILDGDQKLIIKTADREFEAKSVIVAIGMGEFTPRKMEAPGEIELEGKGVGYFLPLKEQLVGKKVVLFGGGNSAIEMAMVADSVAETSIVHRRPEFRADEINVKALKDSNVTPYMGYSVKSFNGTDRLRSITLLDADKKETEIPADLAIINIGITADLGILTRWGLELTENGLVKCGFDMSTNRHGVFVCGDVVDYPGKYKQIITGCGEAATACLSAYKFVKKPYWA